MIKTLAQMAAFLVLSVSLIACSQAPLSQEQATCRSSDWFEKGRQDGATGATPQWESHKSYCGPIFNEESKSLYMNGYHAGLTDYCTPENAFKIGQMGGPATNQCPEVMKETFQQGHSKGLQSRDLKTKNEELARKIESLSKQANSRRISSVESGSVTTELEQLKKQYAKNQKLINRMNN